LQKTPLLSASSKSAILTADLPHHRDGWLLDCDIRELSRHVLSLRRMLLGKLHSFLTDRGFEQCDTLELRSFLSYIRNAHESQEGRWGDPRRNKPLRPRTLRDYHAHLRAFFRWLVKEGVIESCPMDKIDPPVARGDQIKPFTQGEITSLLAAAKKSKHPRRDEAIMLLLLDTGMRVSELTNLRVRDIDLHERRCTVLGKGNKRRTVYFGKDTTKALFGYLRDERPEPGDPLFRSDRGRRAGDGLTRFGVAQMLERAAKLAKISATRCSPHTFRHTMAVSFLRNGGQTFALKELLGHTDLKMTSRYVSLAQADIAAQAKRFSPVDGLRSARV